MAKKSNWRLKGYFDQFLDIGYYEITNGKISIFTRDDDEEALLHIVDALNNSNCNFYHDDWFEFENKMRKKNLSKSITKI